DQDWNNQKRYHDFIPVCERMLRLTSTGNAPWTIVEGADAEYRSLTIARTIQHALRRRLDAPPDLTDPPPPPASVVSVDDVHLLKSLDYRQRMDRKQYDDELLEYQGKLNLLSRQPEFRRLSVVSVFEGFDAAGKGGAIRRVTAALDARQYKIHPVAAPTEEERAQPYLWRFWRRLPHRGEVGVFDRSWYGRVLVERVEGFCSPVDWLRAYREINDFEEQLARHRILVTKFWLSITKDEQAARFQQRQDTGFKQYKITAEDWRNRERWEDYESAVSDMVDHTSTEIAPWTVIPANDKWHARVTVLKTLCQEIEAAMGRG
ncbi:MAG: polyphosphate:AMP phosphotransferase, partial [Chloroflexota bacterium]